MNSPSPNSPALVSASDIAELAGVSRGAVSNWRRRHENFPQQVAGTKTKPLYALPDVKTWLANQGYAVDQVPTEAKVWAALNTLRGRYTPEQTATIAIALVSERVMGKHAPAWLTHQLSNLTSAPHADPNRIGQLREVVDSVDESELALVVDFILERSARESGRMAGEQGFIGSRTSNLLASVASNHPGGVAYDPACGIATALVELAETGAFDCYIGHDINMQALAIAEVRSTLHGVPLYLENCDVLRSDPDPDLRADVVVAEPPFGLSIDIDTRLTDPRFVFGAPPKNSSETAWLQHAIAHLTDTGRAFVITPHSPLFRGAAEERIRTELLRQGCIETVVGLPARMVPHTSIPLALWVLRRPNGKHSDVLLIDASDDDAPEKHVARWLSDVSALESVPHVRISVDNLISDGASLLPQRWLATYERTPEDVRGDFANATRTMRKATESLDEASRRISFRPDAPSRTLSIGDLIREGVLQRIRNRAPHDGGDELKAVVVGAHAITSRTLPSPQTPARVPEGVELTKPSDVLVLTQSGIRALVDDSGGHVLSPVVEHLRVRKPEVVDPHYLAAMLGGSWNTRFLAGTTIQRARLTELEVPLVPIDDQRRIVAALNDVDRVREAAQAIVESSKTVSSSLLDAVRFSVFLDTTER
ncbi:hypothetical protein GP2_022_00660 [Gordonia paraffinivorans NBRC 108238]|uniref:DNA methylase adenine-specific domain-containing protein n=1 Tax=Gordonia paraffinivorans NBRC 108238 TaxID=1223543 RepID=A0ABQ0ILL0_9ACTN|nr:N-6 DNA methylase [Gordonia paraffinivorans]GAC84450.1 hypothetical protein GP2_022_00660 [Gordonia paraffinivorans NBRC 108238]